MPPSIQIAAETVDIMDRLRRDALAGRNPTVIAHEAMARFEALRIRYALPSTPGCDPRTLPGYTDTARRLARRN